MKQILLIILILGFTHKSLAETFCVNNSLELSWAFQLANDNGESDVIKLKSGDYFTINNSPFYYHQSENETIEISGGWFDFNQFNCFSQSINPMNTTIDANSLSSVLFFTYDNNYPDFNVSISNLSIVNGNSTSNVGSGIQMALPALHTGKVQINRVYFIGNDSNQNSALTITRANIATIKNSVFQYNESSGGFGTIQVNPAESSIGVYFFNNTVINNSHNIALPDHTHSAGLVVNVTSENVDGYPKALIANNLFWNNDNKDIKLSDNGTVYFYNNNFQTLHGHPDFPANNMSEPPMLAPQILAFTPMPGSPLIDRGINEMHPSSNLVAPFEEDWSYGSQDFDGFSRVINGRVDIGAVESPPETPIFENSFE